MRSFIKIPSCFGCKAERRCVCQNEKSTKRKQERANAKKEENYGNLRTQKLKVYKLNCTEREHEF
jgi:hypothetical protein